MKNNKLTNVFWGLFFVVIGIGFAGNVLNMWDFDLFFQGWWTFLIIIPCLIAMIQTRFGAGSTMGFIIGVLLFLNERDKIDIDLWKLVIPAILIYIGLRIIFQSTFRHRVHVDSNIHVDGQQTFTNHNRAEYSAVFSSNRIHLNTNEVFKGTNLSAVFGAIVLDLRDASIPSDVEIDATAIFGGIDIFIPRGVQVKINNVPVFGGVSNKTGQFADPGAPTIYLNSTCMFGGIDIK